MKDISFIVPVYNTPIEVLKRCIDSILKIKNKFDIEVIIIDDGSENNIKEFLNCSFANEIIYQYKKNGGVSSARNRGLDIAIGKYIFFVDADDVILESAFQKIKNLESYQMIIFDMDVVENEKKSIWKVLNCNTGSVTVNEILTELITSSRMNSPCSKLFSNEYIQENGLRFDEKMIIAEDINFVIDFLKGSSCYYYTGVSAYCYFREEASRMSRVKKYPDIYYDNMCYLNNRLNTLVDDYGLDKQFAISLSVDFIDSIYNYVSDLMTLGLFTDKRKEKINAVIRSQNYTEVNMSKKKRLKAKLLHRECWLIIYVLAYFRLLYLEIK